MKYYLFGAGQYGKRIISLVGKKDLQLIFDNNPDKWGTVLEGVPVCGFQSDEFRKISNREEDWTIVVSVAPEKAKDIMDQLDESGIHNYLRYEEFVAEVTRARILARKDTLTVYKKAIKWIMDHSVDEEGIINSSSLPRSYPEVTGYYIPTLWRWGYRSLAVSYARWLCSVQKSDGSWYNTEDTAPYVFDTAQVLKGLLIVRQVLPEADRHILAGCEWIFAQMRGDGRLVTPVKDAWGHDTNVCDEVIHIYCLSPLLEAAEVYYKPEYRDKALQIWDYYKKNYYEKIMNFSLLSHFYAYLMEALLDIGEWDMAREAMHKMEQYQKPSGAVPAYHNCDWICSTGLFQLSLVWFRLGEIERGNKAFEYACSLQNESGGWFGSYLSEENAAEQNTYFPTGEISWAVKYFLDALYEKNRAEFDASCNSFLPYIDRKDGRYQIIAGELCNLSPGIKKCVLDIGCGKGRYLKNLADDMPENQYAAVDISATVMEVIDADKAEKKQGTLTDIPYGDNIFDFVYACESLEHAVDIGSAVREMARVTKPGGKLVIIDKNLKALGKMEIGPWEQWFDLVELKEIMERYCINVTVFQDISYEGKTADGLFCAWVGKVR